MNNTLQRLFQTMTPFLIVGTGIAVFIALIIMFSYLLFWGILIGSCVWLIAFVRSFFLPTPKKTPPQGRIIEYKDSNK
jgi:hypothetical protein